MKERLQRVIDYYNLSIYAFSQKIGISDGTIRKILSENTTIRSDNLVKISQGFPDINLHWLLTGQGEMLRSTPAPSDMSRKMSLENSVSGEIYDKVFETNQQLNQQVGALQNEINHLREEIAQLKKMPVQTPPSAVEHSLAAI